MNLWEILKTSKGLPPPDLETLLLARKISGKSSGSSTTTLIANGYPCTLENSVGLPAVGYKIYGNSIQNGTPSPDNPVEIKSVGEPVFAKLYDSDGFRLMDSDGYELCSQDVAGYCIPVVTSAENHEPFTTKIYLKEPLKTGDILRYPENVLEHPDGAAESISLPQIPTFSGTTIISTDTEVEPSDIEITYKSRRQKL